MADKYESTGSDHMHLDYAPILLYTYNFFTKRRVFWTFSLNLWEIIYMTFVRIYILYCLPQYHRAIEYEETGLVRGFAKKILVAKYSLLLILQLAWHTPIVAFLLALVIITCCWNIWRSRVWLTCKGNGEKNWNDIKLWHHRSLINV